MKDVKSNNMRLDRFLSTQLHISRRAAVKLIRNENVSVNGTVTKDPGIHVDAAECVVAVNGKAVDFRKKCIYHDE